MFWPGALCSYSNPPLDPLPLPAPFLDRTPSSFEPVIFSTLQQLCNLFSPGNPKKVTCEFFSTHVISRSQSESGSTPWKFAVKFVIFPVIGYSMFQHLTCLPYHSLQHVQHLFLRPDLVFLKVLKLLFFWRFFLTSNHFNVHA